MSGLSTRPMRSGATSARSGPGRFLDVLYKLEYLAELGVNAIQLLPIQEFDTQRSLGLQRHRLFLARDGLQHRSRRSGVLALRRRRPTSCSRSAGSRPTRRRICDCQTKQLKALVDLCHVYGIAVIFDVVYNHAGGDFGDESIYFFDRQPQRRQQPQPVLHRPGLGRRARVRLLEARGPPVPDRQRRVLPRRVSRRRIPLRRGHRDRPIRRLGISPAPHRHAALSASRERRSIAEYWADRRPSCGRAEQGGAGFDAVVDVQRCARRVRGAIGQAAAGREAVVDLDARGARALSAQHGTRGARCTHLENHDIVRVNNDSDREPRIPALADGAERAILVRAQPLPRGQRAAAHGAGHPHALHGPGVPGGQVLERQPRLTSRSLIWWDGLESDRAMQDHLRFTRELSGAARRAARAARRPDQRVPRRTTTTASSPSTAGSRARARTSWWSRASASRPGGATSSGSRARASGARCSTATSTTTGSTHRWPATAVRLQVDGPPRHGFAQSARVVMPANAVVVFAIDPGD